jgi:hypothetical protein
MHRSFFLISHFTQMMLTAWVLRVWSMVGWMGGCGALTLADENLNPLGHSMGFDEDKG